MTKKFYLSETDKKLGGVCGGVAEYLNIDPLLVRVVFIAGFFLGTCTFWLYIILWLLAPKKGDNQGYNK